MADVGYSFGPFEPQIRFFRRKLNVPTATWSDVWREEHAHAFTVAGAFKADLLNDLRGIVQSAVDGDVSFDQFRKSFRDVVGRHGWDPRGGVDFRSRVIYDTNVRQAFNAGRYEQLTDPDMLALRPYWQYRHNDKGISSHPRPLHVSWNGVVLRADDPWWKTHYPQNGWGCKCGVRALSSRDLERLGKSAPDAAPNDGTREWTNKATGEVLQIPRGIDPGFDYNVGQASRSLPAASRFAQTVTQMPPVWRERALADAQVRAPDLYQDFPPLANRLGGGAQPAGMQQPVGMLGARVMDALEGGGAATAEFAPIAPASPLLVIDDGDLAQLLRGAAESNAALSAAVRDLPSLLAQPDAVYYDTQAGGLAFAKRLDDGRLVVVSVDVAFVDAEALHGDVTANRVRSAAIVAPGDVAPPRFIRLEGAP